jgi:hypothetical protein
MRQAIDNLRHQWPDVRIGGPDATLRGQWLALSLALALVFACAFAIGRLGRGGARAPLAAAPSAQTSLAHSAVPAQLSGGSPIAGAVPVAIAVKPRAPVAAPRAPAPAVKRSATPAREEAPSSARPAGAQEAQPRPEPQPTPAPAPQTRAVESTPPPRPAAPAPRQSAPAKPKPSGGSTFDTSE